VSGLPSRALKDSVRPRRLLGASVRPLNFTVRAHSMGPRQLVQAWVETFNRADAGALASFYSEDAVNHQVAESPVQGRENIRQMFASAFASTKMHCIVENIFEEGQWAILEWRDPSGLRGCGLFHVVDGRIAFQRGYWDKLSFLRLHGLPMPEEM
jgi:limonene-1,2-epoxide hydrolase